MKVALALGSGGARGYAHIGVIRELEARGHVVVGVSGASMGAIVGALHAAGKLDEFEKWVRGLSQRDVLKLLDVSFAGGGAIRANRIMGVIGAMLNDVRIEDLPIPYTAVATDIRARREVWFTRGPADVAVRASFAIPSVVTPALVGGRLMIDGGVTNPVPLEPLASVESDLVLAVSLNGRRSGIRGSTFQESSDPDEITRASDPETDTGSGSGASAGSRAGAVAGRRGGTIPPGAAAKLSGRLRTAAADVRDADLVRLIAARFGLDGDAAADHHAAVTEQPSGTGQDGATEQNGAGPNGATDRGVAATGDSGAYADDGNPGEDLQEPSEGVEEAVEEAEEQAEEKGLDALPGTLRIFDVVTQSIEAMESIVTGYRMAGNRPDVHIEVPSDSCSAFDFHHADRMIALGRRLAAESLDRAGV